MVVPQTPISLEKNSDVDNPFFTGNGHDGIDRHIFDTSESFDFPVFLEDYFFVPRLERFSRLSELMESMNRVRRDLRAIIEFRARGLELVFQRHPSLITGPELVFLRHTSLPVPEIPNEYHTPSSFFWYSEFLGTLPEDSSKNRTPSKDHVEEIRNSMISLYHDIHVFNLQNPPLIQLKNQSHPEHKKISRCRPSHFWQVIE